MPANKSVKQKHPLIVELAGLAGAGKTTLTRFLSQCDTNIRIGAEIELRKAQHIPVFLSNTPFLLPLFLRQCRYNRCFTWEEMKALVYLKGWPRLLKKQAENNPTTILLDHGPIFKLATLHAFGPGGFGKQDFENWCNGICKQWSEIIDLVIFLDAPVPILKHRINTRVQRHVVKDKSEREVSQFLGCYRTSYEQILTKIATNGGPAILRFDTHQVSIQQIADDLLAAFNARLQEGLN